MQQKIKDLLNFAREELPVNCTECTWMSSCERDEKDCAIIKIAQEADDLFDSVSDYGLLKKELAIYGELVKRGAELSQLRYHGDILRALMRGVEYAI